MLVAESRVHTGFSSAASVFGLGVEVDAILQQKRGVVVQTFAFHLYSRPRFKQL